MTGSSLQVIVVDDETRNSKPHQKLNPTGRYPLLETSEGSLAGVTAICKYFSRKAKKLYGSNVLEQTQIDQWVNWSQTTLEPASQQVQSGIFNKDELFQATFNDATKDLKAYTKTLNSALSGREWLVGNSISLADVAVAVSLVVPLQIVLDGGLRKAMKEVNQWAERVYATP